MILISAHWHVRRGARQGQAGTRTKGVKGRWIGDYKLICARGVGTQGNNRSRDIMMIICLREAESSSSRLDLFPDHMFMA